MSFTTKLKHAFGFRTEADDEEFDTSLPTYAAGGRDHDDDEPPAPVAVNPSVQTLADTKAPAHTAEDSGSAPAPADADPDLAGDIFDSLIKMFNATMPDFVARCLSTDAQKQYLLDSLDESLRRRIATAVSSQQAEGPSAERDRMIQELVRLREDNKQVASMRDRMEQTRLSAERQKRALTDRVIDLQSRVEDLEAANEKLRLGASMASSAHRTDAAPADAEELSRLQQEVERLSVIKEQLEAKAAMSDAMINDLTAKAAEARKEVEQMSGDMKVVEEISAQLEKVEQMVTRKDARIAELTEANESLQAKLDQVVQERESMRRTIENNLYNQAHTETRLRKEIKTLEKKLADAGAPATEHKPKSGRSRRKISAIDESLDNTDWFDSTPPPGEGKPESPENPDFGYQAPQRKKHNDNDAQMLLW